MDVDPEELGSIPVEFPSPESQVWAAGGGNIANLPCTGTRRADEGVAPLQSKTKTVLFGVGSYPLYKVKGRSVSLPLVPNALTYDACRDVDSSHGVLPLAADG